MHITIFDRPYPRGRQTEAIAISQAAISGECLQCPYRSTCSTDDEFSFPDDAACMKIKKNLREASYEHNRA